MRLTDLSIRKLNSPETGRKIYFDEVLPGFGVRVSKRYKNFVVLFGKPRRYKSLGHFPELSLADARKEAKVLLASSPVFQSRTQYAEAVRLFIQDCENHNRPSTVKSYRHYLNVYDCKKRVSDITRKDIQIHLGRYKDKPSGYNHALTVFKLFFNWCIRQEIIDKHPVVGERSISMPARDRVLSPEEITEIWAYHHPRFSTIIKLCLLTGQRRSEIAQIFPEWIKDDVLSFPGTITKNKRKHSIPVSPLTIELLEGVPFGQKGKPWNGWSNGKRRIDKYVQISHWTIHDLRRTFSTIHAEIGTPIHITEKLLNHASGTISGVAFVYNRYSYLDEMREAQEKYEDCLTSIIES